MYELKLGQQDGRKGVNIKSSPLVLVPPIFVPRLRRTLARDLQAHRDSAQKHRLFLYLWDLMAHYDTLYTVSSVDSQRVGYAGSSTLLTHFHLSLHPLYKVPPFVHFIRA